MSKFVYDDKTFLADIESWLTYFKLPRVSSNQSIVRDCIPQNYSDLILRWDSLQEYRSHVFTSIGHKYTQQQFNVVNDIVKRFDEAALEFFGRDPVNAALPKQIKLVEGFYSFYPDLVEFEKKYPDTLVHMPQWRRQMLLQVLDTQTTVSYGRINKALVTLQAEVDRITEINKNDKRIPVLNKTIADINLLISSDTKKVSDYKQAIFTAAQDYRPNANMLTDPLQKLKSKSFYPVQTINDSVQQLITKNLIENPDMTKHRYWAKPLVSELLNLLSYVAVVGAVYHIRNGHGFFNTATNFQQQVQDTAKSLNDSSVNLMRKV